MGVSDILAPSAVKVVATISSKKRLFQELGEIAAASYGLDAGTATAALQDRESLGPTAVGGGVALPHARIGTGGRDHVHGAFVRLDKAMEFAAVDRQPVDLVFALFAPLDAGVEHLKALALVSRTMRDTEICAKLRANSDPAALHAILTETRGTQAA